MQIQAPDPAALRETVTRAINEDLGPLDITTAALIPPQTTTKARIFTKENGTLAGLPAAEETLRQLDPELRIKHTANDGDTLTAGQTILELQGNAAAILTGERTALNFLQYLSGIATRTRQFANAIAHTKCLILDTRKTAPGLRQLSKYAVRCGGGHNHRHGLYDAFMPKDNHISLMANPADMRTAVTKMRTLHPAAKLIFEADTLEQVKTIAALGVDQILLDNMNNQQITAAIKLVNGRAKLEASGNITLERAKPIAETGVDYISIGALTHSVRALDLSLEFLP
jgi:nicotinate-nucleotide pyrophosphorylase (carboxylating)